MNSREITIREGVPTDAPFVASVVMMAIGGDATHPFHGIVNELSARDDAQYSYCNALVAEVDGCVAGAIVGYDGARLHELREPLQRLFVERTGEEIKIEEETSAGEFYLDSFAVSPQYRGLGIGSRLLVAARDRAFSAGFERVGLLVDFENPRAEKLYASLGFVRVNATTFLGHDMWHMQAVKEKVV